MRKRAKPSASRGTAQGTAKNAQFVTALGRGLDIVQVIAAGDEPMGNLEIVERTGLPKATVSRLTYTLWQCGFLHYDPAAGRYHLGPAAISLGYSTVSGLRIREIALPFMQELAQYSGVAVALGLRDGADMVYIANSRPDSLVTLRLNIGSRIPIMSTAMGLAYLNGIDEAERKGLIDSVRETDMSNWPVHQKNIERARQEIAETGFCMVMGLWKPEVSAVGAFVGTRDGTPPLAITCGGASFLLDAQKLRQDLGPRLVELTRHVTATLDGR
ncbi:MAG: IclR family transcriptional regulator [Pseudomonadota bacterium]